MEKLIWHSGFKSAEMFRLYGVLTQGFCCWFALNSLAEVWSKVVEGMERYSYLGNRLSYCFGVTFSRMMDLWFIGYMDSMASPRELNEGVTRGFLVSNNLGTVYRLSVVKYEPTSAGYTWRAPGILLWMLVGGAKYQALSHPSEQQGEHSIKQRMHPIIKLRLRNLNGFWGAAGAVGDD